MKWVYYSTGILFCCTAIYFFRKNVFEEDKKVIYPVLLMILGVTLIAIGTAIDLEMID